MKTPEEVAEMALQAQMKVDQQSGDPTVDVPTDELVERVIETAKGRGLRPNEGLKTFDIVAHHYRHMVEVPE